MFLFRRFRKHDILELPQLPRERAVLQSTINDARRTRRFSRLMNWASINLVVWSLLIWFVWRPMHYASAAPPPVTSHKLYLTMVHK